MRDPKRGITDTKKKELLVSIIMAVIMSVFMGWFAVFLIRARHPEQFASAPAIAGVMMYFTSIVESIIIGIIIALALPQEKMGRALAMKAKAVPSSDGSDQHADNRNYHESVRYIYGQAEYAAGSFGAYAFVLGYVV